MRLIRLDADRRSWGSITNNFRSVTFVKQPPSEPGARSALTRVAARPRERESGALAGRRGQAGSKHTRDSRNRGSGLSILVR